MDVTFYMRVGLNIGFRLIDHILVKLSLTVGKLKIIIQI